jgi:ribosome maturation factor RimP
MASQMPPVVSDLCRRVCREQNVELHHLEFTGHVLRVMIDVPGGTSLDACARFSRALSAELDAADALRGRYVLEVSSPGVERRLNRPTDFVRALGALVRIRTPMRTLQGKLLAADDERIQLKCSEQDGEPAVVIGYADVAEARLVVDDAELFRTRPQPALDDPARCRTAERKR